MERAKSVPGALFAHTDSYVRDASGGFVVTTPTSWYLPAAQSAHAAEPVADLNVPGRQAVHTSEALRP
jgi:hypothetical protein